MMGLLRVLLACVACMWAGCFFGSSGTGGGAGDVAACPQGEEKCSCYPNGTCNAGLSCGSGVCVRLGDSSGAGAAPAGGEGGGSGGAGAPEGGSAPVGGMAGGVGGDAAGTSGGPPPGGSGGSAGSAGSDACAPGSEGCACAANGTCSGGLACASGLCVSLPVGGSGGMLTGGTGGAVSGGTGGGSANLSAEQLRCLELASDECERCGCTSCAAETLACRDAGDSACTGVYTCARASGCSSTGCYCGTVDVITCLSAPNGPCIGPIQTAAGTTDASVIATQQTDPSTSVGRAEALSACLTSTCSASCP